MDGPAVKLADLLRHPDDLDKIATLKDDFARKKAAVDSQLRAGLREQLETTQSGMTGLTDGQKTVQQIKEEMMQIDKLCSESQNMIKDFATINLVSQAQRNFGAVEAMRRNLETFNERLSAVEAMLRADDDDQENMPNLLSVHYELTQLRNIRDDAMEQIQRADDASLQSTLEDYFERLDGAIDWFDEHVGLVATSLISLVTSENNGLVVRFALVIEAEETSDQRVQALQEAMRDHKEMASRFQGIVGADGAKTVRGYKEKFLQAIRAYGEAQLEQTRAAFVEGDPARLEKELRWFFNDLNAVRLGMAPLMPRKWHIMKTYTGAYHDLMHGFLIGLVDDPETSSAHTLEIINWPDKYYKKMQKLGFRPDDAVLQPHVLDNRGGELVREFRQLIIQFLDEWIERIGRQERKDFDERATAEPGTSGAGANLDQDEYGYFRTRNLVDLWRMLREQLDVAANSQRADVVEGVVDAMFLRLRTRQQAVQKMLEDEAARYEDAALADSSSPPLEGFQALQDWLVAAANDQIACIDDGEEPGGGVRLAYVSSFRDKVEPLVSPQYMQQRVEAEVAALRDGYVDLSTWCMGKFAALVFAVDFRNVLADFFMPQRWYGSTTMKQMVATLEEYVGDYRQVLHHSLVDVFVEILSDTLLARYLLAIRNKGVKIRRSDPFQDQIFSDVAAVFDMFETVSGGASPDLVAGLKQTWRVTEQFLALLSVPKEQVPDAFVAFKTAYWDVQIGWVEAVLRARDDFDRGMLNAVKARAAQVYVDRGPETIMSKVK